MATPQNSGNTPARPNETTSQTSLNDTVLESAVTEAAEHPDRAAELAEAHKVGDGLWFSPEEVARLRRAAWNAGMWTDGSDPALDKLLGDPEDMEEPSDEDDDDCIDDVLTAGTRQPIRRSPHAEALRYLARWRDKERLKGIHGISFPYGDQICEHFTYLTWSPDFPAFLAKAIEPVANTGDDPNWRIAWFGAEMFAAGILVARREFGRRAPTPYDLELNQGENLTPGVENLKRLARGLPELDWGRATWKQPHRSGVQQLTDLFRAKINPESVTDEALLSGGFWTQEEVDEAREMIRKENDNKDAVTQIGGAQ